MNRQSGFTLLEIIIALVILALVFASLYGAYSGTVEATERVEHGRDVEQAARLALMQMADDFKSLYHQEFEGDPKASPYRFVGGATEEEVEESAVVEFASTAHLDFDMVFPSLRINRVSYALIKLEEDERYQRLVRVELPFADLEQEGDESSVELTDGVEELTLTFFTGDGEEVSEWDSSEAQASERLPQLIRIRLKMGAGEGGESRIFTTSVAPPLWQGEGES
jgi:type II secretion system protein J